jgi:glycosyltransferase involved in cell wall biosynthesis
LLSICIPTYNTDCSELLDILAKQIVQIEETAEVLVCDDFSTEYVRKNQEACQRNGFLFFENQNNIGRVETRKKLISKIRSKWVLFIDADMIPKRGDFISQYLNFVTAGRECTVVGGYCYQKKIKPFNLRLRYGRNREEIGAVKRQLNPYKFIFSGNVLIKKVLFNKVFDYFSDKTYGGDIYLSSFLKSLNKEVVHISNEVYHLGLENNREFLNKIQKSGEMLARLHSNSILDLSHIRLLRLYFLLNTYLLINLLKYTLMVTSPFLKTVIRVFGGPLLFVDLLRLYFFLKAK